MGRMNEIVTAYEIRDQRRSRAKGESKLTRDEEDLTPVVEHRLQILHLLRVEDLAVLAEAVEDGAVRCDVEKSKGSAEHGLSEALVQQSRCLDGASNEGEVHGGHRDGRGELDDAVDAEVEPWSSVTVRRVDPLSDVPALREHEDVGEEVDEGVRSPESPTAHRSGVAPVDVQRDVGPSCRLLVVLLRC